MEDAKVMRLRISEKTIAEIKTKAGEDSLEYKFIETLVQAQVPFSIVAKILNADQSQVRDYITYRRKYPEDMKDLICVRFKKVLDYALDLGLLPCTDIAVVKPIIELTIKLMGHGIR